MLFCMFGFIFFVNVNDDDMQMIWETFDANKIQDLWLTVMNDVGVRLLFGERSLIELVSAAKCVERIGWALQ